jgi:hypothetical protein
MARIFHELLSPDGEDGRACPPCEQGEAGGPPGNRRVLVSVPERYVAGADTRGRQEWRPYYSRSLRSAQSRKRVPSFVVAAGDS